MLTDDVWTMGDFAWCASCAEEFSPDEARSDWPPEALTSAPDALSSDALRERARKLAVEIEGGEPPSYADWTDSILAALTATAEEARREERLRIDATMRRLADEYERGDRREILIAVNGRRNQGAAAIDAAGRAIRGGV